MRDGAISRRNLLRGALTAASSVAALKCSRAAGIEEVPSKTPDPGFAPAGELHSRIKLTQARLTGAGIPAFSDRFILADVALEPAYRRRFSNYSGDLSGRYFGALALLPGHEGAARLDSLVRQALVHQRADGRFGDARLSFSARDIGREQMALLWGNGRLLVGLLEYHSIRPSAEVLSAAKRLGEFLLQIQERCANPELAGRLASQGASGYICFTQLIEALVLLGRQAREPRYYDAAAKIVPWLQPRGNQHSHGFLTTLRGIIELYAATKDASHLRLAEAEYRKLVDSADYTIFGGVMEYFGSGLAGARAEEKARDEGCSEADFVRLSLQLWQATGKINYLERAERCLLNEFYFNQFNTGDFGHHTSFQYGYRPTESAGRAWWCCTMHGLRAFRDVLDNAITTHGDAVRINLFEDGNWSDGGLKLRLKNEDSSGGGGCTLEVMQAPSASRTIALRRPAWAERTSLRLNGKPIQVEDNDVYSTARRPWQEGDTLEMKWDYRMRLVTREGIELKPEELGDRTVEAAFFCGPYLLGTDSNNEAAFFGEPWMGGDSNDSSHLLISPSTLAAASPNPPPQGSLFSRPAAHRRLEYIHGGWPDRLTVTLRPISEQTANEPGTVAIWLRCRRS